MFVDILGYVLMALFCAFGAVVMLWGGLATIATIVAFVGAMFEDFKSLSNLFKK